MLGRAAAAERVPSAASELAAVSQAGPAIASARGAPLQAPCASAPRLRCGRTCAPPKPKKARVLRAAAGVDATPRGRWMRHAPLRARRRRRRGAPAPTRCAKRGTASPACAAVRGRCAPCLARSTPTRRCCAAPRRAADSQRCRLLDACHACGSGRHARRCASRACAAARNAVWPLVPRAACAAPDARPARPRRQLWLIYLMKVLESFGYFSLSAILTARLRFFARAPASRPPSQPRPAPPRHADLPDGGVRHE